MKMVTISHNDSLIYEEYGIVTGHEKGLFSVETASGNFKARKAVSCLVEPSLDDRVLICFYGSTDAFILAVLKRPVKGGMDLSLDGDVRLVSRSGSLRIEAGEDLDLKSGNGINMESDHLKARFRIASVVIDGLSYVGEQIQNSIHKIKTVADVCESFFDRRHLHARNSFKTVEETDTIKAGTIHKMAQNLMTLRGRFTVLSARKDVKIDGKHIHMG